MMRRKNREVAVFSLSAVDLFCSGMGAVMVVMVLLMPYFKKTQPLDPTPAPTPTPVPAPVPEPTPIGATIRVEDIDVVFVIDATMSMEDEISAVKGGLVSIVQVLRRLSDEVRVGFVAYIDRDVPWSSPLAPVNRDRQGDANLRELLKRVAQVRLVGNRDWPEHVYGGLEEATSFSWPSGGTDRRQMIIIIGDAPTHPEHVRLSFDLARRWVAGSPQRSISAVNTGNGDEPGTVPYLKELARVGRGTYLENQGDLIGSILDLLIVR